MHRSISQNRRIEIHGILRADNVSKALDADSEANLRAVVCSYAFGNKPQLVVISTAAAAVIIDGYLSVDDVGGDLLRGIIGDFYRSRAAGQTDGGRLTFRAGFDIETDLINHGAVGYGHARGGLVQPRQSQNAVVGTVCTKGGGIQIR